MMCTYAAARPPRPRFNVELGLNPVLPLRSACCKYFLVVDSEIIFWDPNVYSKRTSETLHLNQKF